MRRLLLPAILTILGLASHSVRANDKPPQKQFQVEVQIYRVSTSPDEDDKLLVNPQLIANEGQPFTYFAGNQVPIPDETGRLEYIDVGHVVQGKLVSVKDGKAMIDVTIANSQLTPQPKNRVEIQTESTRMIRSVGLGKVMRLRWPEAARDRHWRAEITVREMAESNR